MLCSGASPEFTSGAPSRRAIRCKSAPVTPDLTRGSRLRALKFTRPGAVGPNTECGATFWKREHSVECRQRLLPLMLSYLMEQATSIHSHARSVSATNGLALIPAQAQLWEHAINAMRRSICTVHSAGR